MTSLKYFLSTLLFALFASSLLAATSSQAQQVLFSKQEEDNKVLFNYLYQDSDKNTDEIKFSLELSDIKKSEALLLANEALNRAASDFVIVEGKKTAEKYLFALQQSFDSGLQAINSSIAIFNSNSGVKVLSITLREPKELALNLELHGDKFLDIRVSSLVPGIQFHRETQALSAKLRNDSAAIIAQANQKLPKGLSFSIVEKGGSISFPLKNDKIPYDSGTRARANQEISKTSARLRSRINSHKQLVKEFNNFAEATKARAKELIDDTSVKLAVARKSVISDMKAKRSEFYARHYLLPSKKDKERTLLDYARIANQSVTGLLPLARAFKNSAESDRERVANALHFFQNIPYNDLTQGKVRGFRGFSPPLELISENLGDCDSKTTAMMGLLQTLAPKLKIALFLVPKHALLGVELPAKKGEATYSYQGVTYVLMEPTGPRVRPMGSLIKSSYEHLQAGRIDDIITLQGSQLYQYE